MVDIHFPRKSRLHKIFNRSTLKVSYSTMPNMERMVKNHNTRIVKTDDRDDGDKMTEMKECNCRNRQACPLEGSCLTESIIYQAEISDIERNSTKKYIGLTEGPFKQRYYGHTSSFRNEKQ